MKELVALHKHWCTADAAKLTVGAPVHDSLPDWPKELLVMAQLHASFLRIAVWYSLLYVVVEGYRELKLDDARISELLANEQMTDALRRFRNAVFHYQEDPVGPKLMVFLETKESETWAHQLHSAFKAFFEKALPLKDILQSVGATSGAWQFIQAEPAWRVGLGVRQQGERCRVSERSTARINLRATTIW